MNSWCNGPAMYTHVGGYSSVLQYLQMDMVLDMGRQ